MYEIYDVLEKQDNGFQKEEYDPEKFKEQKKEEKDKVYQMIEDAVKEIKTDEHALKQYLDVQSKLDRYSVSNTLLIMKQCPEATRLKEFRDWKEMGAYIKRNQKGIEILEPHDYTKEDGTSAVGYNVKKVFDISQTTMRPPRGKAMPDERAILRALIDASPLPVRASAEGEKLSSPATHDEENQVIIVQRGLDNSEFFRSVAKLVTNVELAYTSEEENPKLQDFQKKCATYMICKKYGVDTKDIAIGKMPKEYTKLEPMDFREKMNEIKEAVSQVNNQMNISLTKQREAKNQDQER